MSRTPLRLMATIRSAIASRLERLLNVRCTTVTWPVFELSHSFAASLLVCDVLIPSPTSAIAHIRHPFVASTDCPRSKRGRKDQVFRGRGHRQLHGRIRRDRKRLSPRGRFH